MHQGRYKLARFVLAFSATTDALATSDAAKSACSQIQKTISSKSAVFYPLSSDYSNDIEHYFTSSQENAACSVEVGSNADTAKVLEIIGNTKSPFAVKSGGHASNQGFSSTPGVQIAMTRFNQVALSSDKSYVTIGMGMLWTDVYAALQSTGYNVVGGRVSGPGTGGFTLGGGYAWKTNQFGMTCDTVKQYTVVLPDGSIKEASSSVNSGLFFALKGGLNRFGIVTEIQYFAHKQTPIVYGGYQVYPGTAWPALLNATNYFQKHNTDAKAQTILTLNGAAETDTAILLSFYDGPTRPAAFAPYDGITPLLSNISSQSYTDFAQSIPSQLSGGSRGAYHSIATNGFTNNFLKAVQNETLFYSNLAVLRGGQIASYDIEPFGAYGIHATDSAFPHANSPTPTNLYFGWTSAADDQYWQDAMATSVDHLRDVAKKEGIFNDDIYTYPNYALARLTAEELYGPNTQRLRTIRQKYDPKGVMLQAGGFAI